MLSNTSLNKKGAPAAGIGSRELTIEELSQVSGAWATSDTGYYDDPYDWEDEWWGSGYAEPWPSEPYYEPYNPYPDYPPADGGFGGGGTCPYAGCPEPTPPDPDYPDPQPYPDYYYNQP